jgi:hypothetical protein
MEDLLSILYVIPWSTSAKVLPSTAHRLALFGKLRSSRKELRTQPEVKGLNIYSPKTLYPKGENLIVGKRRLPITIDEVLRFKDSCQSLSASLGPFCSAEGLRSG